MLKQRARLLDATILALDLALVAAGFLAAYGIRQFLLPALVPHTFSPGLRPVGEYLWLLALIVPVWTALLLAFGVYRSQRTAGPLSEAWRLVRVGGAALTALALVLFTTRLDERVLHDTRVSRIWLVAGTAIACVLLAGEKLTIRLLARRVRRLGLNDRTIVIVGSGPEATAIADAVERHRFWGYRLLGLATLDGRQGMVGPHPVLGRGDEIETIARAHAIDEVIFAVDPADLQRIGKSLAALSMQGTRASLALNVFPPAAAQLRLAELDGVPLLTFPTAPSTPWLLACKRGLDVTLSAVLLVVTLPLFAAAALGVRLSSGGPILFRQMRCGRNGRPFVLYKFRTMVVGAEARRAELAHLNEMDGPVFKVSNDPRVTPWGRVLRKLSLDELPQLWNVLKGDMSLVGPRPPIPEEVSRYEPWQRRRLSMRPGLTCLWQVNGRNRLDFSRWMELDLEYIDTWSLLLDLKILARTVPVVMTGRGAS